jgi:hypothetical protein
VERSDTHHLAAQMQLMGIASLHPSYRPSIRTIFGHDATDFLG